jgi:hypothetical protein
LRRAFKQPGNDTIEIAFSPPQQMNVEFHSVGKLNFRSMSRETSAAGR